MVANDGRVAHVGVEARIRKRSKGTQTCWDELGHETSEQEFMCQQRQLLFVRECKPPQKNSITSVLTAIARLPRELAVVCGVCVRAFRSAAVHMSSYTSDFSHIHDECYNITHMRLQQRLPSSAAMLANTLHFVRASFANMSTLLVWKLLECIQGGVVARAPHLVRVCDEDLAVCVSHEGTASPRCVVATTTRVGVVCQIGNRECLLSFQQSCLDVSDTLRMPLRDFHSMRVVETYESIDDNMARRVFRQHMDLAQQLTHVSRPQLKLYIEQSLKNTCDLLCLSGAVAHGIVKFFTKCVSTGTRER